jgi:hypothetical protein
MLNVQSRMSNVEAFKIRHSAFDIFIFMCPIKGIYYQPGANPHGYNRKRNAMESAESA